MDKCVIYTCIVGGYDPLRQPAATDPDFDFVCFVGKGEKTADRIGVWQIRELDCGISDPALLSRYPKMHPHLLLPGYGASLWIDGNIEILDGSIYDVLRAKFSSGVKYSGDVAKAIVAGASSVMMGSMFAGTDEAPGKIIVVKGRRYKQYRGMGSLGVMTSGQSSDRYFQKKGIGATKYVPEGVEGATPYVGSVTDVIYQTIGGLKSAMGYTGSKDIESMRKNARFVRITAAGLKESHPHDILITDEAPNYRMGL